jgi:Cytochrome bd-type quinol oxidase, subunit 2
VPIDGNGNADGSLTTLLNPYAILGGVTTVLLFLSLGAIFLTLRTKGELAQRARRIARAAAPAAAVAGIAFLAWTIVDQSHQSGVEIAVALLAIVALEIGRASCRERV